MPDPGGCREQVDKGASLPAIGACRGLYDLSQSRRNPQAAALDSNPACTEPQECAMNVSLKPFDFAQAVARAGLTRKKRPSGREWKIPTEAFSNRL